MGRDLAQGMTARCVLKVWMQIVKVEDVCTNFDAKRMRDYIEDKRDGVCMKGPRNMSTPGTKEKKKVH